MGAGDAPNNRFSIILDDGDIDRSESARAVDLFCCHC